jgi:twinkle protein
MEVPVFAQKLGSGKWIGTAYVLDVCPMCCGSGTMRFGGRGMWGCTGCKKGGKDLLSFRKFISENPLMKEYVPSIIIPAKPENLVVVSEYHNPYTGTVIGTGFGDLDYILGGLTEGALTIVTGKRGGGKSVWIGNLALNAINNRHKVCFYSGELSTGRFQTWLFGQAAGANHMYSMQDQFGANRWIVSEPAEQKIRQWLGENIVLYDNTKSKSSERKTILKSFNNARAFYGSDIFFVDNLMTAKFDIDDDNDALRAQANFAAEMMDFARQNNVHVVLVAHPKKGETEDINDSVAGFGDITNMATNVIQVKRLTDKEKLDCNYDTLISISKNREYGDTGSVEFYFDKSSRRFVPTKGSYISRFNWEDIT